MPCGVPAEGVGKNKIEFFVRVGIQVAAPVVYCVLNARVIENMAATIKVMAA